MFRKKIRLLMVLLSLFSVMLWCSTAVSAATEDGIADWHTILVNPWNKVPEDYSVTLKKISGSYKVDTRCHADLAEMLRDCRAAGYEPQICSAYRTQSQQEYLYWNKVNKLRNSGYSLASAKVIAGKSVAVPGTSEHQLGLAVDIVDADYPHLNNYQAKQDTQKWLMKNSWKYGFILRYPTGKSDITGIIFEPWHYRYVGHTLAEILYKSGLTLEEYLEVMPDTPVVTASNNPSDGAIKLTWEAVKGADKYEIYRSSSEDGKYIKLSSRTETTYTNVSVTPGKKYYYKVKAVTADGYESKFSNVTARTRDLARPVVTASNDPATGAITLKWKAIDGTVEYEIYRSSSADGKYTKLSSRTGTTYTNVSVTPGKKYYYKVKAICSNSAANSADSIPAARTCDLSRPVVTASNDPATGAITLTWKAIDGAVEYDIYRSTSENGKYTKLSSRAETTYTNVSVTPGKKYYYKVKAIHTNSAANSADSIPAARTRDLARPVVTASSNPATGAITLNWKAIDGAVEYEIYRSSSADGKYTKLSSRTGTTYTNVSVTPGKKYYYKVKAICSNSAANSADSTAVSITSEKIS